MLDVGCGRGEYALYVARAFRSVELVVGIDAQSRDGFGDFLGVPPHLAARVRLVRGAFSAASVAWAAPFDAILCVDVLEHVDEDRCFLADIAAVSGPSARLLLHVPASPQRHPIPAVRCELVRMLTDGSGQHVREGYAIDTLCHLLESTGWRVRRVRATFGLVAATWCNADFYLATRRDRFLRAAALPATVLLAAASARRPPKQGNGWLVLAER